MSLDRREKIEALLHSPVAGERAAARAALDRIEPAATAIIDPGQPIPAVGSNEWHDARIEWAARIQYCVSRLGSPVLTNADVVTVRRWSRGIGCPWDAGAEKVEAVYRKLVAAEQSATGIRKAG